MFAIYPRPWWHPIRAATEVGIGGVDVDNSLLAAIDVLRNRPVQSVAVLAYCIHEHQLVPAQLSSVEVGHTEVVDGVSKDWLLGIYVVRKVQ